MGDVLSEALAYPRRGNAVLARHALGGVFLLFGSLVFPTFLIYGYLVRVVRGVAAGDQDPPEWDDWEALFVDGLKYFAVAFLYGLPVFAMAFLGGLIAVGAAVGVAAGSGGLTATMGLLLAVYVLVLVLVASVAGYLVPAAIVHFALEGDVEAAFQLRTIVGNALSWPYAVAWLKTIGVGIVLGIAGTILVFVFLVGLLVYFYLAVVAMHLLTTGYLEAAGADGSAGLESA